MAVVDHNPRSGAHHRRVTERIGQVGGEPVDEAVTVRRLDPRVVVIETNNLAIWAYTDEQRAAISVEEAGDGLDDRVLLPAPVTMIDQGEQRAHRRSQRKIAVRRQSARRLYMPPIDNKRRKTY